MRRSLANNMVEDTDEILTNIILSLRLSCIKNPTPLPRSGLSRGRKDWCRQFGVEGIKGLIKFQKELLCVKNCQGNILGIKLTGPKELVTGARDISHNGGKVSRIPGERIEDKE